MRTARLAAAAVGACLAVAACDFTKRLTAERVLVGTLLNTPQIQVNPTSLALPDGGMLPADAGIPGDAGTVTLPAQTVAYAFFGERDGLDNPPTPIAGATITLGPANGTAVTLKDDGNGNYSRTSAEDSKLVYTGGATYHFTVSSGGETFTGEVENAPATERISRFHEPEAPNDVISLAANTALTFTRPTPASGQEMNLGFVTVFPVSTSGARGEPTYTNIPNTPLGFIKLIASPGEWKQTSVTIPGTAFPQAGSNYVIVFSATKTGGPKSTNLFIGSPILVGTADVGVVRTQ